MPFRSYTRPLSARAPTTAAVAAGTLALLALLPAAALPAQVILNTERFQLDEVEQAHGSVDASFNAAFGNVRVVNVATSGIVGYRGTRHWPRVIAGGQFLADGERRVLDENFVQLRYGYIFSDRTESFHFWQLQSNRSLLLRRRMLIGSGARTALVAGEASSLHVGTGLMYEAEDRNEARLQPNEESRLRTWRMANQLVARHRLSSGATVLNILYFQPAAGRPADFHLLNELGITAPLAERVSMTARAEWRHDSRPPAALRRDDLRIRMGLRVDVR
jgi:putative salt-induced outer membrane protein YdiY